MVKTKTKRDDGKILKARGKKVEVERKKAKKKRTIEMKIAEE